MKNTSFLLLILLAASCARQNLNYQSSRENNNHTNSSVDNYSPAPEPQAPPANNSYNYNETVQNDYQQQNYNNNQVNYNDPSYQTFYDELSPYGYWVNNPTYGYVWVPNVGPQFSPYYSNGQWAYTNYGWTWVSNYNWGWAPFHYGRWFMDPYYGWMWVPGHEWAPAWVVWGETPGYYGWAPMGPGAVIYEGYRPPSECWNYVPAQYVTQTNISNYAYNTYSVNQGTPVNYNNVTVITNNITYNQGTYNGGPKAHDIEQVTGKPITALVINASGKPTANGINKGNELNIYKPVISNSSAGKAVPVKITPVQNLKQVKNVPAVNQNKNVPARPNEQTQPTNNTRPNQTPVQPNNIHNNEVPRSTEPVQHDRQNVPVREIPVVPNNVRPNATQPRNIEPVQNQAPRETPQPRPSQPAQNQVPRENPPPRPMSPPVQNQITQPRPEQPPVQNQRPAEPATQPRNVPQNMNNNPRPQPQVQPQPQQQQIRPVNRPRPQPPVQTKPELKRN